jgi:hypothetical protein
VFFAFLGGHSKCLFGLKQDGEFSSFPVSSHGCNRYTAGQ